jgi:hypothetical protein
MLSLQLQPHQWCNGRSGEIKDYEIGICCFSVKHAALKEKERRLVGSESGYCVRVWRHVYLIHVASVSTIKNQLSVLV